MSGFFDRMLGRGKESSANKAKERLQFVLVHDRINLPPERLKAMKAEILAVISKYVAVSADEVDIALEQRERNQSKIIAEIPFSKSLEKDGTDQPAYPIPPDPLDDDDDSYFAETTPSSAIGTSGEEDTESARIDTDNDDTRNL